MSHSFKWTGSKEIGRLPSGLRVSGAGSAVLVEVFRGGCPIAVGRHNPAEVSSDPFNHSTQPLPLSSPIKAGEPALPSVARRPRFSRPGGAGGRLLRVIACLAAPALRHPGSASPWRLTCVAFCGLSLAPIRG